MPNNETTIKRVSVEDANEFHIVLADNDTLLSKENAVRLASFIAASRKSRRSIPDWIAQNIYQDGVRIFCSSGAELDFDCNAIDSAFNEDGSFRWISDFVKFASKAPRQKLQDRVLERIRLLEAATVMEMHGEFLAESPFRTDDPMGAHDWLWDIPVKLKGRTITRREYQEYKNSRLHRKAFRVVCRIFKSMCFFVSAVYCITSGNRFAYVDRELPLKFKIWHFHLMTR
jgi:hypothetical protein